MGYHCTITGYDDGRSEVILKVAAKVTIMGLL